MLKVGTTAITLPVQYQSGFREWSFKSWIKFNDFSTNPQTIITIPSLFSLKITGSGTAKAYVIDDDLLAEQLVETFSGLDTSTWYIFSIGFSYSTRKTISEMRFYY